MLLVSLSPDTGIWSAYRRWPMRAWLKESSDKPDVPDRTIRSVLVPCEKEEKKIGWGGGESRGI
jgi:hypothetical protein